jgi:hypothetical protein
MQYKKNIQKLIIHCLNYIMNEDNTKDFKLLNNFNNFNLKTLKLTEIKLYINNILISKFNIYAH